ncbi:MAG: outer membrane beta-barrel protein [Flavobacteriaceae bacterium]|nr:MAG: outer membrane beta-barrel protein [Flavobacteriaceae bacterium]
MITRKFLAVILFMTIGFYNMEAQEKGSLELGLASGINLSNVSNLDNSQSADLKTGFNAKATAEYYFSDRWGIKSSLIYDQKGYTIKNIEITDNFGVPVDNINLKVKVNYLTIPVMANWHFGSNRNWYLHFGSYFGFLLSAKESYQDQDIEDSFQSVDIGFNGGIGYKFEISDALKLFFEYDAQSGFTDILENVGGNSDTTRNFRSSFNVGILFRI